MTTLASGISSIKTAVELVRILRDAAKGGQLAPDEFAGRIGEIYDYIIDSKNSLVDAQEENLRLKRELDNRLALDALAADMEYRIDGSFYVRKSEITKGLIAYCPDCWARESKAVPMKSSNELSFFRCSVHDTFYETEKYRQLQAERAKRTVRRQPRSGGPYTPFG